MIGSRWFAARLAAVVLLSGTVLSQSTTNTTPVASEESTEAVPAEKTEVSPEGDMIPWSFSAAVFAYFPPEDRNYASPIFTVDGGVLHLEARYNYEDLETGSAFVGWNFSFGDELSLELTPMVGGVFGNTNGIAPGYELTLSYWGFELYSEGEYVFDLEDSSENFFYNWSELSYSPLEWLRLGLATQRTKVYETDLDIQRGLLLGFSYKFVDVTTYLFNIGWDAPTVVLSVGLSF